MKYSGFLKNKVLLISLAILFNMNNSFAAGSEFHYQFDLIARLVTMEKGELAGVEMSWLYDTETSSLLMGDENLSEEDLKGLTNDVFIGFKEVDYFTRININEQMVEPGNVEQYNLNLTEETRLQFNMLLPLTSAVPLKGQLLKIIISDSSATGLVTFNSPNNLKFDESLKSSCRTPQLKQSKLEAIDGHIETVETITVDCR